MIRSASLALLIPLASLGCGASNSPSTSEAYRFVPKSCAAPYVSPKIQCGSVSVPENYDAPSRRIDLNIIVFRALNPSGRSAQLDLDGGPGFAVTDSGAFYVKDGESYRRDRDVVLADMRGTGGSNPLRCEAIERETQANPLTPMYPPELVTQCVTALASIADVREYTTQNAARDIESIRLALGYDQLDLNALSYGTILALRYVADYPNRVRSAVLTGTVPADKAPPRFHASAATQGLSQIFAACAKETSCAKRFPTLREDLDLALSKLAPEIRPVFMESIRTMLYAPLSARRVPLTIHAAAKGDVDFLKASNVSRVFADGLYLSINCAESIARIDMNQAITEADATPFGAYRLRRQLEACKQWPIGPVDEKLFLLPPSDIPALFISGEFDPVTPTEWTIQVAKQFSHGVVVTVPQGGHVAEGMSGFESCLDPLILAFVAKRSVTQAELACVQEMTAGEFAK